MLITLLTLIQIISTLPLYKYNYIHYINRVLFSRLTLLLLIPIMFKTALTITIYAWDPEVAAACVKYHVKGLPRCP